MFFSVGLLAPLAMILPLGNVAPPSAAPSPADAGAPQCSLSGSDKLDLKAGRRARPWLTFQPWRREREARQTRVEQRIIVRISPARPRDSLLPREVPRRVVERKMGKCVALDEIVAVQTGGANRLILYLGDRRMVSAQLPKSCSAREFYSGFYVEPSKDGRLCSRRDKLQSRNGTKCEITQFAELVPA